MGCVILGLLCHKKPDRINFPAKTHSKILKLAHCFKKIKLNFGAHHTEHGLINEKKSQQSRQNFLKL